MAESQLDSPYAEGRQTLGDHLRIDVSESDHMKHRTIPQKTILEIHLGKEFEHVRVSQTQVRIHHIWVQETRLLRALEMQWTVMLETGLKM
jgi:hypothetical protein